MSEELDAAKKARRNLLDAMDSWPDVGDLAGAFVTLSRAKSELSRWIADQESKP